MNFFKLQITAIFSVFLMQGDNTLAAVSEEFIAPPANRYFYIKSVHDRKDKAVYWDQPGFHKKFQQGANLLLGPKDKNIDRQFRFISAGKGMFYIESKNGGLVDVDGGKSVNGANVQIWSGHGGSNQLFRFKYLGKGRWKIYTFSGMAVSAEDDSGNGSNVQIWEDSDNELLEWYFEDAGSGKVYEPAMKVKR